MSSDQQSARNSSGSYMGRKRRRYLLVPESEDDLSFLENAYRDYDQKPHALDTFASSSQNRIRRLLPSTQVLMSSLNEATNGGHQNSKTTTSLSQRSKLFENFYKSIGMHNQLDEAESISKEAKLNDTRAQTTTDEIDDTSRSTLRLGHHRRYLQLTTNSKQKRTPAQRKELQKLHQLISTEQAQYRMAVDKFHDSYKSRYMIGFDNDGKSIASAICRWACSHALAINQEWKAVIESNDDNHSLPKCYGKVRQTLGLHSRTQQSSLDVQDLTCSVVHQSTPKAMHSDSSQSTLPAKLLEISLQNIQEGADIRKLSPPTKDAAPPVQMLRKDSRAMELAAKHSVDIITTSETLESLLNLPGHHSTKWILPCQRVALPKSSNFATILDLPLAQAYSSPRSCLETGLQESVYQTFLKRSVSKKDSEQEDGLHPPMGQFVYSLWTLPTKNSGGASGSRRPTRVLIRTLVRLRDAESKLPVRMRAHVEYFSTPTHNQGKSRREIPNSYEKSLWILDQILFGHQVFSVQYRIDPVSCEIAGWDTTSVAHAFAASDTIQYDTKQPKSEPSPLDHWKTLIHLLQSIPSIDVPHSVLCLPGLVGEKTSLVPGASEEGTTDNTLQQHLRLDPFSVSVHGSHDDPNQESSPQPPGTIRLDKNLLDRAGGVLLGDQAIRDCRREWEWDRNGQVPNTFPVLEKDIEKGSKT